MGPAIQEFLFMNHAELSDSVAAALGLSKAEGKKAVDAVFAAISGAAAKGDDVSVNGFGKFKVKESAAREGRNPSTGATIQIAASKKLGFSAAKAVKDRLNG
jgi:DNA-binding protein HU-beta